VEAKELDELKSVQDKPRIDPKSDKMATERKKERWSITPERIQDHKDSTVRNERSTTPSVFVCLYSEAEARRATLEGKRE